MKLNLINEIPDTLNDTYIVLSEDKEKIKTFLKDRKLIDYYDKQFEKEKSIIKIDNFESKFIFPVFSNIKISDTREAIRVAGSKTLNVLNSEKEEIISITDTDKNTENVLLFLEGLILANYKFIKYFKDKKDKESSLKEITIYSENLSKKDIKELENLIEAVFFARDLANEPFSNLNALQLAERIKELEKFKDFSVEIWDKKTIEREKMGGLLAVNKGSDTPPVFIKAEYKPENAINKKPYVIVGKGIVFDSGGYSIKPTKNSMDLMKFDMAGAAASAGFMYAAAANKLPIHLIALIPATDNAVDAKSYVPGDIIKMHNGLFVEVLNTDAEGRLILADALSYAEKYKPELVIDLATLTGAAAYCIGTAGSVIMGTADDEYFSKLEKSGFNVYERTVRFPFWDEYKEMIKSKNADIKNIGGSEAGAITAGKFLEYFTDYPWIHIDIAGPAILNKKEAYRTEGGSGYGVRLLYDFFKNLI